MKTKTEGSLNDDDLIDGGKTRHDLSKIQTRKTPKRSRSEAQSV